MSKSSTVTVRERPVESVASATVGGLTVHGETIVVQTDQRIELIDLTNRVMEFVREVKRDGRYAFVDAKQREACQAAFDKGVACILKCQIVVDGREAWAMTGLRRWRTQSIGFSTVLVRTCGRIAELTLHADPSMLDALATDWGALLDSVRLAAPVAQSPIFAEEAWRNDAGCSGPERSVRR